VDVKVDTIQEGMCQIIPELKTEIENLKQKNKELVLSRDQQEAKTAQATKRINAETDRAHNLGVENLELKAGLQRKEKEIKRLQGEVDLMDAVKHIYSLSTQMTDLFQLIDENERAHKCARYN
jgi:molecular chaperone GrpE (heat shock protein)